jgi:hypothetical protein
MQLKERSVTTSHPFCSPLDAYHQGRQNVPSCLNCLAFRSSLVDSGGFIVDVSFDRELGASPSPLPVIDAPHRIVEGTR